LAELPIKIARFLGSMTVKHRYFPFLFIILIFYILPLLLIYNLG
jgi:hypothetical protein